MLLAVCDHLSQPVDVSDSLGGFVVEVEGSRVQAHILGHACIVNVCLITCSVQLLDPGKVLFPHDYALACNYLLKLCPRDDPCVAWIYSRQSLVDVLPLVANL